MNEKAYPDVSYPDKELRIEILKSELAKSQAKVFGTDDYRELIAADNEVKYQADIQQLINRG